jgi:glycosyltransferase involved in cell wall biosynthesis
MSRKRKKAPLPKSSRTRTTGDPKVATSGSIAQPLDVSAHYAEACKLAAQGQHDEARRLYAEWQNSSVDAGTDAKLRALIHNDLAVMAAIDGRSDEAHAEWKAALEADRDCLPARLNRDLIEAEISLGRVPDEFGELKLALAPGQNDLKSHRGFGDREFRHDGSRAVREMPAHQELRPPESENPSTLPAGEMPAQQEFGPPRIARPPGSPVRIAILSFLFNWPSTGGGNHHTAELAAFLARGGYDVKHFFARFPAWGIGRMSDEPISPSEAIEFDEASWTVPQIQARYRRAVDAFAPGCVMITDAWNMKPLLADAVRDYPFFLLYQAQENICPLNNLRLLATGPTQFSQCPRNQLATPEACCRCLAERGRHSGALHRAERELAMVGTREYDQILRRSLLEAEAVLVLNPVIGAILEPFSACVRIVPWGMDPGRFPWPGAKEHDGAAPMTSPDHAAVGASGQAQKPRRRTSKKTAAHEKPPLRLFMAAFTAETIKGYHVAHEACKILRETRSDFELVVTFDPPGPIDEFTRSVGWCSLNDLPKHYREADICLVPTIAQDSLSRTSVEAMASGIPVVASRIGGLPYTVTDGVTGLLFEPGEANDLARKIAVLLDDPDLRRRMGLAGRKRFEEEFLWEDVIDLYFRPLLSEVPRRDSMLKARESTRIQ